MVVSEWAAQFNIPAVAVADLRRRLGAVQTDPALRTGQTEANIQTRIRLEASRKGARLFRNNVGATYTKDGSFLRYGLANDSKKMNDRLKSSDLIGIRPVVVTPDMVGHTVGQFVAREVKAGGWSYSGTGREPAQLAFLELIAALGGDAAFASSEGTI